MNNNRKSEYLALFVTGLLEIGLKIWMAGLRMDREERIIERRTDKYLEAKEHREDEEEEEE